MLQQIRERATGWILWVIIILIGVPFAFFGVYNYLSGPPASVAAKVDGVEIPLSALNNAYQQQRQRLEQIFGGQLDPSMIDEENLRREALEQLIDEAVLNAYVADGAFAVSDAALARVIRSQEYFQADGRFSRERYETTLARAGMSPSQYESRIRRSEMVGQVQGGVYGSAFITDAGIERLVALQNQEREISYLRISAEPWLERVSVEQQEIEAWYEEHPQAFRTPERLRIAYVPLSAEQLMDEADLSEETVRARYEELKASRYTEGGTRRVSHILLELPEDASEQDLARVQARMDELQAQLADGADFAELAREHSQDPGSAGQGGDLGELQPGLMVEPFEEAAVALEEGEVSEPVRTQFGLHLIKATEVAPGEVTPFAQVREELRRELAREQLASRLYELGNELENLAYEQPDSLQPAAETLGLEVQQSDWFTREQGEGIAAEAAVREAAFGEEVLEARRNSRLIELEDGRLLVLRVAEHEPAGRRPLDEVEDEVAQRVRQDKAAERAAEQLDELEARLAQGENLQALASPEDGLAYVDAGRVARADDEHPAELVARAFELGRPAEDEPLRARVALEGGDQALLQVSAVYEGAGEQLSDEERAQWRRQLAGMAGNAELAALVQALRAQADITVYEDRL